MRRARSALDQVAGTVNEIVRSTRAPRLPQVGPDTDRRDIVFTRAAKQPRRLAPGGSRARGGAPGRPHHRATLRRQERSPRAALALHTGHRPAQAEDGVDAAPTRCSRDQRLRRVPAAGCCCAAASGLDDAAADARPPLRRPRGLTGLEAAAQLCSGFGRVADLKGLAMLLGKAAEVIDASGIVVWLGSTSGADLRPVLRARSPGGARAHARIPRSDDDPAAAASGAGVLRIVMSRPARRAAPSSRDQRPRSLRRRALGRSTAAAVVGRRERSPPSSPLSSPSMVGAQTSAKAASERGGGGGWRVVGSRWSVVGGRWSVVGSPAQLAPLLSDPPGPSV